MTRIDRAWADIYYRGTVPIKNIFSRIYQDYIVVLSLTQFGSLYVCAIQQTDSVQHAQATGKRTEDVVFQQLLLIDILLFFFIVIIN